ncbi:MAG: acetylglutamate kinase [Myxococcales bacterium]|nr:MAG: acetylglutamate kinase [Myxococcales bacterium]
MEPSVVSLKLAHPYIHLYRGKVFVIKVGGGVLANKGSCRALAGQIALLSDLGIRVVIVHGGGPQASELSRKLGIEPAIVAGRRITSDDVLNVAVMTYAGAINTAFVATLSAQGVRAVGLTGVDAGSVKVHRRPPVTILDDDGRPQTVDFGHVGDIDAVEPDLLTSLLDAGFTPTIACVCADAEGKLLNVNADGIAEAVAAALQAKKLIFVTEVKGLLGDPKDGATLIPFIDHAGLARLLESGSITAGMRPKVEACMRATKNGVKRTHIINGNDPDSLLIELFTGKGCGTMIVSEREKQSYQNEELA